MKARVLVSAMAFSAVLAGCGVSPMMPMSVPMNPAAVEAESLKGIRAAVQRSVEHKFFAKDKDKNKKITPAEYEIQTPEDFVDFKRMDENGDGTITLAEVQPGFFEGVSAWLKVRKTAKFMFHQVDKNDNNQITLEEAKTLNLPGVEMKWAKFAGGPKKAMKKRQFEDFFAELLLNGDKPLKPGANPPAPPADPNPPAPPPAPPAPPVPGK